MKKIRIPLPKQVSKIQDTDKKVYSRKNYQLNIEDEEMTNTEKIKRIKKALSELVLDFDDISVSYYEDYSGRGMFGSKCFGVVTNDTFMVIDAIRKAGIKDVFYIDDMGLDKIVYYKTIR